MTSVPHYLSANDWMQQIYDSREAARGGVVKRQIRDVERFVGRDAFVADVARRGFQAVENGRHYVIFCNAQPIRRLR